MAPPGMDCGSLDMDCGSTMHGLLLHGMNCDSTRCGLWHEVWIVARQVDSEFTMHGLWLHSAWIVD